MLEQPCPNCGLPLDINIAACPQCGQPRRTARIIPKWHQRPLLMLPIGGIIGLFVGNIACTIMWVVTRDMPDQLTWAAIGIAGGVMAAYGFILLKAIKRNPGD